VRSFSSWQALNYLFLAQTVPAPELLKNFLMSYERLQAEALDKSPAQRRTVRCTTPLRRLQSP
jgi:hypothetical protein